MDDEEVFTPPPLPSEFEIPRATIEAWANLPLDDEIPVAFTRREWDNLFFSFSNMLLGVSAFQQAMIEYTNGRLQEANKQNDAARRYWIESQNRNRSFFASLMAKATTKSE